MTKTTLKSCSLAFTAVTFVFFGRCWPPKKFRRALTSLMSVPSTRHKHLPSSRILEMPAMLRISMRQANRISVKNGRILRYVSDPQVIDIKHDEPTGSFVCRSFLTRESTNLFCNDRIRSNTFFSADAHGKTSSGQNLEIEEAPQLDLFFLTRQPELLIRQKKESKSFLEDSPP